MSKYLRILVSSALLGSSLVTLQTIASTSNVTPKNQQEDLISFRFNQASLLEIIDMVAQHKSLNIVIPAGHQSITEKITFSIPNKITVDQAWQHLLNFLRICGYSVSRQKEFVSITKNDVNEISRQSYTLYVHTKPEDLPDNDERIRYLYYFYNLQLAGIDGGASVIEILKSFLSNQATILIDEGVNGVIITDTARHISSAITLLKELDVRQDSNDGREILPLKHTVAANIAAYLQSIINPGGKQSISDIGAPSQSPYFSKSIRIVAEPRTNSLILLGKKDALKRTKTFIEEYIDVKLDAGNSTIHVYDLQYLDAPTFRQTLTNILSSQGAGATYGGQSSGSSQETGGKQYFKDVKIISESLQSVNPGSLTPSSSASLANQAGNRLIIAAKRDDWLRIEKLIKDLDKPQMQVAIEVLIVDLNIAENKTLGSQLRNLADFNLQGINFQTSHLGGDGSDTSGGIVQKSGTATSADILQADLLSARGTDNLGNQENMASKLSAGSFVLSFKDPATGGMWLVSQILNSYEDTKIISQPFLIALNNQTSLFDSTDRRLLPGGSSVIPGGGGTQSFQEAVDAHLKVNITPMIGRDSENVKITLAINIDIQEFKGDTTEILTRNIQTNVTVGDGDILILGGLTKSQLSKSENSTPVLSRIPILGNLFKSKANNKTKDNLLVFISPRIIMPRKGMRFDPFTASKITNVNHLFDNGAYNEFKDPITHWFFGSDNDQHSLKKIRSLQEKTLFNIYEEEGKEEGTVFINADEKIPDHMVKKIKISLPSPDKNVTTTNSNLIAEKTVVEKVESIKPKVPKIAPKQPKNQIKKQPENTKQGVEKAAPQKEATISSSLVKKEVTSETDELKKLSSQLKKPIF